MKIKMELEQFCENARKELKQLYGEVKRHPLACLGCIIVIIISVFLLIALPYWRVTKFGITNPKDLADAENNYRATLAQILGGVAVGIGIYFAWRNLTTAREGQITERFTRAVDQLGAIDQFGNPAIEIRLGGIYALERISNESEKDYWPIMEILTSYVRMNSNVNNGTDENFLQTKSISMDIQANKSINGVRQRRLSLDAQAVLTILGRRKHALDDGESKRLNMEQIFFEDGDLKKAHFEGARFFEANLKHVDFGRANLTYAVLWKTDLEEAFLKETNLTHAFLREANLRNADLQYADLTDAIIFRADLRDTYLVGANLTETNLTGANLEGANLTAVNLTETKLTEANLTETNLTETNLTGANLTRANLTKANLGESKLGGIELLKAFVDKPDFRIAHYKGTLLEGELPDEIDLGGANLKETDLTGAILEGANLKGAENLTSDQLSKVKTLYKAQLDPEIEIPLREKYPALFEEY